MKMRIMGWMGVMAVAVGACLVASGESYWLASKTNMPPMPFNAWPGWSVSAVGGDSYVVDDMVSDAVVLSRGLMMDLMDYDDPPAPGSGGGTNAPSGDTNAWIGTWIHGLSGPQQAYTNNIPEPCTWLVACTNAGGSIFPETPRRWHEWSRVCPHDTVAVLYPTVTTNLAAGWYCFLVLQQGTNAYGGHWTNAYLATMDNTNHDQGNWAVWEMPEWPTNFVQSAVQTNGVTNAVSLLDTNYTENLLTNFTTIDGETNVTISVTDLGGSTIILTMPGGSLPPTLPPKQNTPAKVDPPSNPPILQPPTAESQPIYDELPSILYNDPNAVQKNPMEQLQHFISPNAPNDVPLGSNPTWPKRGSGFCDLTFILGQGWSIDSVGPWIPVRMSDCNIQTSTNVTEIATNTVWMINLAVNGVPTRRFNVLSTTNLTAWRQEGNTNFTLGPSGYEVICLVRTNKAEIEPTLFFRLMQLSN